ncbi:hypothetical protein AB0K68_25120 [Streptomyces sp. NPDC050698]
MRAGIHTFTESGFRQCPPEAGQRGQKCAQRGLGAIDAGQAMRGDLDAVADTAGRHGVAGSFHVGGDQCQLRLRTSA